MQTDLDPKSWVQQLELTAPIKSIMGFVDELAANYDRRVAGLKAEFKSDMEEIVACYKNEKRAMELLIETKQQEIIAQERNTSAVQQDLTALQQVYKIEVTEHKITKDALQAAREEIVQLSAALKSEQELIAIAHERIRTTNDLLELELEAKGTIKEKKYIFSKTREFFVRIFNKKSEVENINFRKENISF